MMKEEAEILKLQRAGILASGGFGLAWIHRIWFANAAPGSLGFETTQLSNQLHQPSTQSAKIQLQLNLQNLTSRRALREYGLFRPAQVAPEYRGSGEEAHRPSDDG